LIAELEEKENVEVTGNVYIKQDIIITRGIGHADLFDQMPSLGEDFWVTLLCHGGGHLDECRVSIDDHEAESGNTRPLAAYRWYPRTLFKTLLLVSAQL